MATTDFLLHDLKLLLVLFVKDIKSKTMASAKKGSERNSLPSLFHAIDVDNSGRTEKREFSTGYLKPHVLSPKSDKVLNRMDTDKDGRGRLKEFVFKERHQEEDDSEAEDKNSTEEGFSKNKGQLVSR